MAAHTETARFWLGSLVRIFPAAPRRKPVQISMTSSSLAPISSRAQETSAPIRGVETPFAIDLYDRNRKWPVLRTDGQNHPVRVHGIALQFVFIVSDAGKFGALGLVLRGVSGGENRLALWAE